MESLCFVAVSYLGKPVQNSWQEPLQQEVCAELIITCIPMDFFFLIQHGCFLQSLSVSPLVLIPYIFFLHSLLLFFILFLVSKRQMLPPILSLQGVQHKDTLFSMGLSISGCSKHAVNLISSRGMLDLWLQRISAWTTQYLEILDMDHSACSTIIIICSASMVFLSQKPQRGVHSVNSCCI